MIDVQFQVEEESFLREIAATEMDISLKLLRVMEQVGWEVVSFLRSIGHGTQPPARPGEPSRSAHPGSWADISSNLANAYRFELYVGSQRVRWVEEVPRVPEGQRGSPQPVTVRGNVPSRWSRVDKALELKFLNGMEYAAALEARDGYWVIREITGAGGPVTRALRTVLSRIAPDARISE